MLVKKDLQFSPAFSGQNLTKNQWKNCLFFAIIFLYITKWKCQWKRFWISNLPFQFKIWWKSSDRTSGFFKSFTCQFSLILLCVLEWECYWKSFCIFHQCFRLEIAIYYWWRYVKETYKFYFQLFRLIQTSKTAENPFRFFTEIFAEKMAIKSAWFFTFFLT